MTLTRDNVMISAIWWRLATVCRDRRPPCFITLLAATRWNVIIVIVVGVGVQIWLVSSSIGGAQVVECVIGYVF